MFVTSVYCWLLTSLLNPNSFLSFSLLLITTSPICCYRACTLSRIPAFPHSRNLATSQPRIDSRIFSNHSQAQPRLNNSAPCRRHLYIILCFISESLCGTIPSPPSPGPHHALPSSPNFTLRATPWGSSLSHGEVTSATTAQLLMVGGGTTSVQIKASSRVANAPPCTALSTGWCKFPYCGFPQPSWPAWSPPTPPPAPPAPPPNFPPPTWTPNWNLTESTTIQPSGNSYFMPNHTWGLVSLDWYVSEGAGWWGGRGGACNIYMCVLVGVCVGVWVVCCPCVHACIVHLCIFVSVGACG